jgi:hypothetical protein
MNEQIFEIAKMEKTEKLNPETFDYKNAGLIDPVYNFMRVRMIFDGMIIDKINEERKARIERDAILSFRR